MSQRASKILEFLRDRLSKQGLRVEESGPMNLISQVNWAIRQLDLEIDANQAFDIAGEIYRNVQNN